MCVLYPLPKQGGGDSLGGLDAPLGTKGGGGGVTARTKRVGVLVPPFLSKGGGLTIVCVYPLPKQGGGTVLVG